MKKVFAIKWVNAFFHFFDDVCWVFLGRAANRFRGGVIGTRIFFKSLGYNFVSFKGMSLKLIQEAILDTRNILD